MSNISKFLSCTGTNHSGLDRCVESLYIETSGYPFVLQGKMSSGDWLHVSVRGTSMFIGVYCHDCGECVWSYSTDHEVEYIMPSIYRELAKHLTFKCDVPDE